MYKLNIFFLSTCAVLVLGRTFEIFSLLWKSNMIYRQRGAIVVSPDSQVRGAEMNPFVAYIARFGLVASDVYSLPPFILAVSAAVNL